MAVAGGPNTSELGLVLCLDAGNPRSYQSGSTTWFDLSGNNNSGSLVSGSGYSSANFGSITFNGTGSYISGCNFINYITSSFTISTWVNFTDANSPTFQKIFHVQSGSSPYAEVNLDNYNGGSGSPGYGHILCR